MSVIELYNESIKPLSTAERLSLAKLILESIPLESVVDYSEEWTDEDLRDFNQSSWAKIDEALEERADA